MGTMIATVLGQEWLAAVARNLWNPAHAKSPAVSRPSNHDIDGSTAAIDHPRPSAPATLAGSDAGRAYYEITPHVTWREGAGELDDMRLTSPLISAAMALGILVF
jgi:hypothetical protein